MAAVSVAKLCTLMVHSPSHNSEELLLNPDIFYEISAGDFIQIYDPQNYEGRLILKVPSMQPITSRLEISLTKIVAEANNLKPFSKVVIEKIEPDSATLDFVELSFKRQYLQRGNFFRFQNEMLGRPVYLNQSVVINGIQAQIQELRRDSNTQRSGIITDRTKFVFRSRSARIIWLVQISAEMWEFDQNGDLYFEKFLRDFVSPLLDKWKTLGVSHMLTVVFFSRTFFLERVTSTHHPDLYNRRSFGQTSDGFQYQDSFKIVIENIAEFDQTTQINRLRQEFWDYPKRLGWRVPQHVLASVLSKGQSTQGGGGAEGSGAPARDSTTPPPPEGISSTAAAVSAPTPASTPGEVNYSVPSDSVHGNFLEAINMSLNILSKHYLDRDLLRTNNSIVMISAGTGVFKVKPNLNQITKQRMLDNAFGIDFISLARPTVETVPLFLVDCRLEGVKNFYEMPHWMRVSYIDCRKEISETLESCAELSKASGNQDDESAADALWGKMFMLQPTSSLLTAQLVNSGDLKQLAIAYANTLPLPLREIMSRNLPVHKLIAPAPAPIPVAPSASGPLASLSREVSVSSVSREVSVSSAEKFDGVNSSGGSSTEQRAFDSDVETLLATGVPSIPTWGTVASIPYLTQLIGNQESKKSSIVNAKSTFLVEDLLNLKALALSTRGGPLGLTGGGAAGAIGRSKLRDVIEDLPILQRDRGDSICESLNSALNESNDDDSEPGQHSRHTGRFISGTSYEDDEKMKILEHKQHYNRPVGNRVTAASMDHSSYGDNYLVDTMKVGANDRASMRAPSAPLNPSALVEDLRVRQTAIQELSKANGPITKEKLIALMCNHDRNIFKSGPARVSAPPTPAAPVDSPVTPTESSSAASAEQKTNSSESTVSDSATGASVAPPAPQVPPAAAAPVAVTVAAPEVKKFEPQPLTKDQKMRAALINGSGGGGLGAARMKQMQQQQQQLLQQAAGGARTESRTLSLVAQQHERAQLQSESAQPALAGGSGSAKASRGDLTSPTRNVQITEDSFKSPVSADEQDKEGRSSEKGAKPPGIDADSPVGSSPKSLSGSSSSAANSATKRYHRLTSKSFLGAKSQTLAATMSTTARPSPEAMARARSANPNQQFAIIHGKIVPINAGVDQDAKLKSEQYAQYIREYAQSHCVNPFRIKDSQSYTNSQSYNRRRWVHVFPQGKLSSNVDYGLNWKSLTQPAILPLTTDFVPSLKMMDKNYDVNNFYQLLIDKHESPFLTPEDLMQELICLRLTQEYQLIENFDPVTYSKFITNSSAPATSTSAASSSLVSNRTGPGLQRMDSVHGRSRELKNFYILSMGHRIQFIQYDDAGVNVTIYRSKEGQNNEDEKSMYNYCYESWSPQANAFITMSQAFYKFNSTEFKWNKLDNIVVGNIPADTYENAMRMKRLKFEILPPEIYSDDEAAEYFAKIDLLIEFFNKYAQGGGDVVSITKDKQVIEKLDSETTESRKNSVEKYRTNSASSTTSTPCIPLGSSAILTAQTPLAMALYKKTDAYHCDTAKFIMRSAKQGTPNWLYCRYDKTAYTYKAYHMEFHWVVCDAWLIDEMVNLLYRRCLKWGIRLSQVPQYYSTEDLNVHPFRALPFIPVPRTQRESIPGSFPTPLRMVERMVFSRRNGWLFDNEYKTDWAALSMSAPSYLDRDRDLLGYDLVDSLDSAGSATTSASDGTQAAAKPHAFSSLSQSLSRMVFRQDDPAAAAGAVATTTAAATVPGAAGANVPGATRAVPGRKPASARRLDRQYVHSSGLALARVAGQGFLWMQNAGSRVSDVTSVIEERRELVQKNMTMLTQSCERVTLCYELCVDVIERAMEYAHMAQMVNEFISECFDEAFVKGEETLQERARQAAIAAALAAEIAAAEAAEAAALAEAAAEEEARREAEFAAALEEQAIREREMEMEFSAPHSMANFGEEDALDSSNPYNPSFYFGNASAALSSPKAFDKQNSRENSVGYMTPLETVPEETAEDLHSDNEGEGGRGNEADGDAEGLDVNMEPFLLISASRDQNETAMDAGVDVDVRVEEEEDGAEELEPELGHISVSRSSLSLSSAASEEDTEPETAGADADGMVEVEGEEAEEETDAQGGLTVVAATAADTSDQVTKEPIEETPETESNVSAELIGDASS